MLTLKFLTRPLAWIPAKHNTYHYFAFEQCIEPGLFKSHSSRPSLHVTLCSVLCYWFMCHSNYSLFQLPFLFRLALSTHFVLFSISFHLYVLIVNWPGIWNYLISYLLLSKFCSVRIYYGAVVKHFEDTGSQ